MDCLWTELVVERLPELKDVDWAGNSRMDPEIFAVELSEIFQEYQDDVIVEVEDFEEEDDVALNDPSQSKDRANAYVADRV